MLNDSLITTSVEPHQHRQLRSDLSGPERDVTFPSPLETPIPLPQDLHWLGGVVGELMGGFVYVLGGAPGSGKSRLATQLAVEFARSGQSVGMVLTEESESRLRGRVRRLLFDRPENEAAAVMNRLGVDDTLPSPELLPNWIASNVLARGGRFHGIRMLVIDSLMGHGLPATSGRRWERVFDALRLTRQAGLLTLCVCHLNKSNALAGPRTLVHNCDAALMLRQLGNYRLLFATKNRCGPTDPRHPAKLEFDPATLALRPCPLAQMQVIIARSYLAHIGEIEVQTAVGLSLGNRRRIVGSHLPRRELEQLMDVVGGVPGVDLNDLDFSVSCRLPGAKGYWPTLGLPLCMALLGSATQRVIPTDLLFIGEVDLLRRIRDLTSSQAADWAASLTQAPLNRPSRVVCSRTTAALLQASGPLPGVECHPCDTLDDATQITWPHSTQF